MKKGFIIWLLVIVAIVIGIGCGVSIPGSKDKDGGSEVVQNNSTVENEKNYTVENGKTIYYIKGISEKMIGQEVTVKCKVLDVTDIDGNVHFTLRDIKYPDKKVKGIMFKKTNNDNKERKEVLEDAARNNKTIKLDGKVDKHKNILEVKVWRVIPN